MRRNFLIIVWVQMTVGIVVTIADSTQTNAEAKWIGLGFSDFGRIDHSAHLFWSMLSSIPTLFVMFPTLQPVFLNYHRFGNSLPEQS